MYLSAACLVILVIPFRCPFQIRYVLKPQLDYQRICTLSRVQKTLDCLKSPFLTIIRQSGIIAVVSEYLSSTWAPLEIFGEIQQGATLSRVRDDHGEELSIIHIRDLDRLEVSENLERDRYAKDKVERFMVRPGDVLISLRANPVKASVVTNIVGDSVIGSNLARVRPNRDVDPYYLAGLLRSELVGRRLSAEVGGSIIPSLSVAVLRKFEIPLTGIDQQKLLAESFKAFEQYELLTARLVEARERKLETYLSNLFEGQHA